MFRRIALVVSLAVIGLPFAFALPTTIRVSVASQPVQGNGDAGSPALSANGRYLAFISKATNLITGGTSGQQVFLRDNETGVVRLVSKSTSGIQGNSTSNSPAISADGRYVAFYSDATNLISGDTNGATDVFVRDVQAGTTTRVSISSSGSQASGVSTECSISADGRYVAFVSYATNLVTGDTNGARDVFVRDVQAGTTTRVAVSTSGTQADSASYFPSISADGRYVAFASIATNLVSGDTNGYQDVYVRDRNTNVTTRVSVTSGGLQGNGPSGEYGLSASPDGRYVAFASYASNLIAGDTNLAYDIFVRDRVSGTTTRASLTDTGAQASAGSFWPTISSGGTVVAFQSTATNLVSGDTNGLSDSFVRNTATGTTKRVSVSSSGSQANGDSFYPSVSADGLHVAYQSYASNLVADDSNSNIDVFLRDLGAGATSRGSVADAQAHSTGEDASVNHDGRYVAFESSAPNLVAFDSNAMTDIFVRDTTVGTTTLVSISTGGAQGNAECYNPDISADGSYVTFSSSATNLVSGDTNGYTDIFVRDVQSGTTTRVSVSSAGTQANNSSVSPSISADGRYVAFRSSATNLVTGDTNSTYDIFVRDMQTSTTTRVSVSSTGAQATGSSNECSISADGRYVAFQSNATNLVSGDTNGVADIFLRDTTAGTTTRVSLASDGIQTNGGHSFAPSVSNGGRYVAFYSSATNLVSGDTNGVPDIFVRDILTGTTFRASASFDGSSGNGGSTVPSISSDGRYVTFRSEATNLIPGDTNGVADIFVRDLMAGMTSRLSISSSGLQSSGATDDPDISGDGRFVAFETSAADLVPDDTNGNMDVFLRGPLSGGSPPPVALEYVTQTEGALAGQALAPQPVVRAVDSNGNTVTTYSGAVSLAIKADTGATGAVLGGTTTVSCVSGVATFTNLSIDKVGTGYVLTATSAGLTSADSVAFNITQVATNLVFSVQPGNATESTPFGTQPIVIAKYPNGTTATDYTGAVTLSIKTGTGTTGAILSGTKTGNCVAGVATFTGLSIDKPGSGYVLTATSPGLTSADSTAFDVSSINSLAYMAQPGAAHAGMAFGNQPVLVAQAYDGSTLIGYTGPVTLSIKPGSGTTGAVLGGTATVNCIAGIATFTDVEIDRIGTGYVLTAASPGLNPTDSYPFDVTQAEIHLEYSTQPSNAKEGTAFGTQPVVIAKYGDGTTATDFTGSVTLSIKSGTGTTGAILNGTKSVNCVAGVAMFTNLLIDKPGTGYILTATSLGLTSADSAAFNVAQVAKALTFSVEPGNARAGAAFGTQPVVIAKYGDGTTATDYTGSVTLAIKPGTGTTGAVLSGTKTVNCVAGIASFTGLSIDKSGAGYVLVATNLGLTSAESEPFTVAESAAVLRVSVSSEEVQANAASTVGLGVSQDGRWVTYLSSADNLVAGDTNAVADVFLRDTFMGTTQRVSVSSDGIQANAASADGMDVSDGGRYVSFVSYADNLAGDDANGVRDVFRHDTWTGRTECASVGLDGQPSNGESRWTSLSADGRYLAFYSNATNIVPGVLTAVNHCYVSDMVLGTTILVDVTPEGVPGNQRAYGPVLSEDGRTVLFVSDATNLVADDTNNVGDVFVRDLATGVTTLVSRSTAGVIGNGYSGDFGATISADGTKVAFASISNNLVSSDTNSFRDIFLRDLATGVTTLVSMGTGGLQANNWSGSPTLSRDGGKVSFYSHASNLVDDDTNGLRDAFVRDIAMGTTTLVNRASDGTLGNGAAYWSRLSGDGRFVTFFSEATNLVPGDTNGVSDLFISGPLDAAVVFAIQTETGIPGGPLEPQPVVHIRNINGELLSTFTGDVTLSITPGTGAQGAVLSGTTTVTAIGGVATFTNLAINLAGSGYVLVAAVEGLSNAESAAFDIRPQANHLAFSIQPGDAKEGYAYGIQPVVVAKYPDGTTATDYAGAVTLAIKSGTGTAGAILSGTTTVNCIAGTATFTNLSIDKAGTGYVLTATSLGLTPADSAAFNVDIVPDTVSSVPYSWGCNRDCQLGDGTTDHQSIPKPIEGIQSIVSVDAGGYMSLALEQNGSVWSWGTNEYGQIGDGTSGFENYRCVPGPVGGLGNIIAISAGGNHCLALRNDGRVYAWGTNWYGQLGDGTTDDHYSPILLPSLTDVIAVSAGAMHSLALKNDGTLWAWGRNAGGTLGDGTTVERHEPVRIASLSSVVSMSAGNSSLAITSDGSAWAWGGYLGDGTTNSSLTPKRVNTLSGAKFVSAGEVVNLVVKTDGTVWAWGWNNHGQLGDGTTTDRLSPVQVVGLNNVTTVSAGTHHCLAVKNDGTIWSWGWNEYGQLGTGTLVESTTPIQVGGLSGITQVSTGVFHSLAVSRPRLSFTTQPFDASSAYPFAIQPVVQALDVEGNPMTTFNGPVLISIKPGTGRVGAVLSGTTTVNAVNGIASFTDLSINLAGAGYVLRAASPGMASADSSVFNVAQTPTKLVYTSQPANAWAHTTFRIQPVVKVLDEENNVVPSFTGLISMSIKSGTGASGATLGGVRTLPSLAGVATFHDLSIDVPGSGYVLTASSAGLTSEDSAAFDVKPLPAQLVFSTQPGGAIQATRFSSQPVLIARDGNGTFIPDFNGPVVLTIKPGTGSPGAVLSGTTTVAALNGVATFTDLSIDKKGTGFVLQASVGGIVLGESAPFNVSPRAEKLVFTTQPGAATDDWPFEIQPVVTVQDADGETATLYTGSITVDIKPETGATGAVLTGTRTITAPQGVATFTDLGISELGSGYVLTATASGLISGDSTPFDVTEAPKLVPAQVSADIVEISVHPAGQTITGTWITLTWDEDDLNTVSASDVTPAEGWTLDWLEATSGLTLSLSRAEGVTSNGPVVSIRLTAKPGISGRTIPVTLTGESYLTDSTFNNTPVKSRTIAFIPGAQMAFTQQPVATTAGYAIAGQPTVAMLDGTGAVVTDYAAPMRIALKPGTGTEGAVLDGTTTLIPASGVAVFTDLTIDRKGTGYVLTVTSEPFSVESVPFDIAPRALKLAFTTQPGTTRAGLPLTPHPMVTVQDEEGSTAFTYSGLVTLAIKAGSGYPGVTLGGMTTVNAVSGIATFYNVNIGTASPGYVLVATGQSLTGAESLPFEVTPFAFTTPDIISALRWASGLSQMPIGYLNRFDVVNNGSITLTDAARIARKVAGLESNP